MKTNKFKIQEKRVFLLLTCKNQSSIALVKDPTSVSKVAKGITPQLRRLHTGCSFQKFPHLTPASTQGVPRGERSRKEGQAVRAVGQRHASQRLMATKVKIKEPSLSFVFSHERLFEVPWLGLNSPALSLSHPPSTHTPFIYFFPPSQI